MLLPVDQICEPVISIAPRDPEDGITAEIEDALSGRKSTQKVATWNELWRVIFPQDVIIHSPGESSFRSYSV
jgi:hypothetical protein